MRKVLWALMGIVLLAPFSQAAGAQKGRRHAVPPSFSDYDRRTIYDYYRTDDRSLPPGLAKRHGNLPPGLQKQLRRNGQLPPGLQNRVNGFPNDLDRRLQQLPGTWRRGIIGDRGIIYDPRTNTILDIIDIYRARN